MSRTASESHHEESLSIPLLLLTVVLSLAGLGGAVKFAAPDSVWAAQVSASIWQWAVAFLAITVVNGFIEYVFHRYVLHKPVVPLLSYFYKQHTLHHNLTRIGRKRTPGGREVPFVENIYPIIDEEQGEASFFPWYTLVVFGAILAPLLSALQWLAPSLPWFFAGYAALATSLILYEGFHAIEHWSFEKWSPLIEHPKFGRMWRKIYSFHLRHHAVIDCNEAISGVFTLPVFDWIFGTFILPKTLFIDGQEWRTEDFTSPRPCALIRWCDRKSDEIVARRRARVAGKEEEFRTYSRGEQIAHLLTHGVGLAAGCAAFVVLFIFALSRGDAGQIASCSVFGITLVLLYAVFSNFAHTRRVWREGLFSNAQHAAALLLIAGTATPFLLESGAWGWGIWSVLSSVCLAGAVLRFCFPRKAQIISVVAYGLIGLLALICFPELMQRAPAGLLWLLAAGAAGYAGSTIFHSWRSLRYHQVARHSLALSGTICHLLAVLFFVLPQG